MTPGWGLLAADQAAHGRPQVHERREFPGADLVAGRGQDHRQVGADPPGPRGEHHDPHVGLTDAVSHARETVTMRMLLDAEPGQPAGGVAGLAQALADGALDTATGACLDFTNSPSGLPGQPCTASFLDCLVCPNAIATRRHLPRLAWLHQAARDASRWTRSHSGIPAP